ncbi:MAG TPA: hypothetical protein VF573_13210 [Paraburkholderia sp.]|uniref:hypothetical protein n=1 Tax=Paraburkholderia sp. TaxID=1926495 RepID=UPI002ED3197A
MERQITEPIDAVFPRVVLNRTVDGSVPRWSTRQRSKAVGSRSNANGAEEDDAVEGEVATTVMAVAVVVEAVTKISAVAVQALATVFAAATTSNSLSVSMVTGRRASTRAHDSSILSGPVLSREQGFFFVNATNGQHVCSLSPS